MVIILWILASQDKGDDDVASSLHKCRGCYWYYHDYVVSNTAWTKNNRDPYPLLIAFGVILCVFWFVAAIIGMCASSVSVAKAVKDFG